MRIIRAEFLGMCFGVRDAIALAVEHAEAGPLTILGDLVHNPAVLDGLRDKGIAIAHDLEEVRTPTVMVTAHGTSERALAATRARGLTVVEATCPLVRVAHRAIKALVRDGYHPVIIGQRNHVEVRGLTDDLDAFDVVLDDDDVAATRPASAHRRRRPDDAVDREGAAPGRADSAAVSPIRRPLHRHGLSADQGPSDCRPRPGAPVRRRHRRRRREQQQHPRARQDVRPLTVRGSTTSRPQSDLRPEWFRGAGTVGITAGTSTPDDVIDRVERRIRELAAVDRRGTDDVRHCGG